MPPLPWTPAELAAIVAITSVGATVQGSVGFGLNLLAAPLLLIIDPRFVPGPILVGAIVLIVLMLARDHRSVDFSGLGWAMIGRLPATAGGIAALTYASQSTLSLMLGGLVLLAVVISAAGVRVAPSPRGLVIAGALAGFMSATSSIGGPPMAMVYQESEGATLRGTLAGHFIVGATVTVIALIPAGRLTGGDLLAAAVLVPGIVVGFVLSGWITPYVDRGRTRASVLTLSALAGVFVILRELF